MSTSDETCRGPVGAFKSNHAAALLRPLNVLCLVCLLLIVYGSFMPFNFVFPSEPEIQVRVDQALNAWRGATRSDIIMNVLLYLPWGLLLATRRRMLSGSRAHAMIEAAAAALLLSVTVEGIQLFTQDRSSEINDVCTNGFGGLLGGLAGALLGPAIYLRLRNNLRHRWSLKPASLAAAAMCLMLAADGLSPLMPVRGRSELGWNLRHSHLRLDKGLAVHPWHRWAVCRVGVFAALAVVIGAAWRNPRRRWLRGAAYAAGFAVALEVAKLSIYDREFNIANVVVGAAGAVVGMFLALLLSGRLRPRTIMLLAAWLSVLYLLYRQWTPFVFAADWQAAAGKLPSGSAWMPLTNFEPSDRAYSASVHFARVLVLMAASIFAASQAGGWFVRGSTRLRLVKALGASAILGLAMELGQFFIPAQAPTTTDVLAFILGGGLGAWIFTMSKDAPRPTDSAYRSV